MKKFKDLKVGDTIYIGFEKKIISDIKPDDYFECDIKIYTSDGELCIVADDLSFYAEDDEDILISVDKDAIIKHYTDVLSDLQTDYEDNKAYFEKMLEKAKKIE